MSVNQWECGEIRLPSTEFARFRQVMADRELAENTELLNLVEA
jgi:hypothetical protein